MVVALTSAVVVEDGDVKPYMTSKAFQRCLASVLIGLTSHLAAQQADEPVDDFPPQRFDAARYATIAAKNPFVAEVAMTSETASVEDTWAKGIVVRAVNWIGGKYVVHVENTALAKEKDSAKRRLQFQRLEEGSNNPNGIRVVDVKAHRDPNQVEVVIAASKDANAKTATIGYDQKATQPTRTAKPPTTDRPKTVPTAARVTREQQVREARRVGRGRGDAAGQRGRAGGDVRAQGGRRGGDRGGRSGTSTSTATEAPKRPVILPPGVSR